LFLDAAASLDLASKVARIMALEAGWDSSHCEKQLAAYRDLTSKYLANR
jgi:hypothetical protein